MNAKRNFALHPLSVSLKWITLVPLLLISTHSFARIIVADTVIDGSAVVDNYQVINNANLTANGATTNQIRVEPGSSLTLNGSTTTATGSSWWTVAQPSPAAPSPQAEQAFLLVIPGAHPARLAQKQRLPAAILPVLQPASSRQT
jgi:hypothetical protein